ncbi:MAG TPA: hypothetical protein VFQ44_25125 [Streptosporangiaceae bacterium]|nr:hypothetical protein [Streptosporangiaceae bacterium]
MDSSAADIIDLSGAPVPWSPEAEAIWADCIGQAARTADLWTTPAPRGDEVIREWIAADQGFDPEQVTIVSSLRAAALTYARCFDHVIVEQPSFLGVMPALASARAQVQTMPWSEIFEGTLGTEASRTVLWLTSPGRNPDGASLSPAGEAALRRRAATGYRVVINATYTWFTELRAPAGFDVLGSLHKLRGGGARLGWVASASFFDEAVPELVGTPPSPVWQRAWGLFLRDGGMALLRGTYLADVAAATSAFASRLTSAHGIAPPAFAGPSVLVPLTAPAAPASEDAAVAEFARQGFKLVAGRHFMSRYPAIRATFFGVTPEQAARFADALAASGRLAVDDGCHGGKSAIENASWPAVSPAAVEREA